MKPLRNVWTVSLRDGVYELHSAPVEKCTGRYVYIARTQAFDNRRRFRVGQIHTDPIECLRDFVAYQERAVVIAEDELAAKRRGLGWARNRLLVEQAADGAARSAS